MQGPSSVPSLPLYAWQYARNAHEQKSHEGRPPPPLTLLLSCKLGIILPETLSPNPHLNRWKCMATERDYNLPSREFGGKYRKLRTTSKPIPGGSGEPRSAISSQFWVLSCPPPRASTVPGGPMRMAALAHSQTVAWSAAGWQTAEVDMEAETLLFRPKKCLNADREDRPRRAVAASQPWTVAAGSQSAT